MTISMLSQQYMRTEPLWKEGSLSIAGNREIKQAKIMLGLLEAIMLLKEVTIVHCMG